MSGAERPGIDRVLVALDAAAADAGAVSAAAELAARLGAELAGLLIEDNDLFRFAALPAAIHISPWTGPTSNFDAAALESGLRRLAAQAEAELADVARRFSLRWSFHTARGSPEEALGRAVAEHDLVVVGSESRLGGLRFSAGGRLRRVVRAMPRPRLILQRSVGMLRPLAVARAGDPALGRALAVAADLATHGARRLDLLLIGRDEDGAELAAARAALAARGIALRVVAMERSSPADIARAAAEAGGDLVVAAGGDVLAADADDGPEFSLLILD